MKAKSINGKSTEEISAILTEGCTLGGVFQLWGIRQIKNRET
jgi:hypothetical protein